MLWAVYVPVSRVMSLKNTASAGDLALALLNIS